MATRRITTTWLRIKALLRRQKLDRDLEDELNFHLAMREAHYKAQGATAEGTDVRSAARRQFGNVSALKEACREMWTFASLETFWQDIRYGARLLRKNPGFTAIAVLTLALGIGPNTAVFSVVYNVILRPLPYPKQDRIAQIVRTYQDQLDSNRFTAMEFRFWQERREPFQFLAAQSPVGFNLAGVSRPERVRGLHVSAEYLAVLGVEPMLGRDFRADEDTVNGPRVAILSNGVWKRDFGKDSGVVGRSILLDDRPYTVIGVMPPAFQTTPPTDVWTTLAPVAETIASGSNLLVVGRLRSGETWQQARAYLSVAGAQYLQSFHRLRLPPGTDFTIYPLQQIISRPVAGELSTLQFAVGIVLLIACVNMANLLLARAGARSHETAVRMALGAGQVRLIRQLLTEGILLALLGAALGVLLARWGLVSLLALTPVDLPRAQQVSVDRWALAFTIGLALLTGILFSVAPALQASKADLNETLKQTSRRGTPGARRGWLRRALVVSEIALALVLLACAGLFLRTFTNLVFSDPGLNPKNLLTVEIWPTGSRYNSTQSIANFDHELVGKIEALPGVQAAAVVAAGLPLEFGGNNAMEVEGRPARQQIGADYREITRDYFRTLACPLREGRYFADSDRQGSQPVVIVNASFAQNYLPPGGVLGRHILIDGDTWREVVGVVGDVKSYLNAPAEPTVFIPAAQAPYETTRLFGGWFPMHVLVRTAVDPLSLAAEVERQVRAVDPELPIGRSNSMEQVLATSVAMQRFTMVLMTLFAGLALMLGAVGIYGVMGYEVAQRSHEMGIRMALGARPRDVWRLVVGEGIGLAAIAVAVGIIAALGVTRLMKSFLFGVGATDPLTYATVTILLVAVALLACYVPARRAMRVEPMIALRYE